MFTTLILLIAIFILGWAIWFVIEFVRYIVSGEYEMDKRLRNSQR